MSLIARASVIGGGARATRFSEAVRNFDQRALAPLDYGWFETADATAYSSLMPWHVRSTQEALAAEFARPPRTIVDATAHIGVDTANFRVMFPHAAITAFEIDRGVAAVLRRNMARVAKATGGEVQVRAADSLEYIRELTRAQAPDLIYLDPPWGGSGAAAAARDPAAASARRNLGLGSLPLAAVVAMAAHAGAVVVTKLPRETDVAEFAQRVRHYANANAEAPRRIRVTRYAVHDLRVRARAHAHVAYWLLVCRAD